MSTTPVLINCLLYVLILLAVMVAELFNMPLISAHPLVNISCAVPLLVKLNIFKLSLTFI